MEGSQRQSRWRRTRLERSGLSIFEPSLEQEGAALTSDWKANLRKIKPARSWNSWVPSFLDWQALYYDSNTGEQREDNSKSKEPLDKTNLDLISHNSKKEGANSQLAYANSHNTSHLAEDFIFDGCEIDGRITDISEQSPQTVVARN